MAAAAQARPAGDARRDGAATSTQHTATNGESPHATKAAINRQGARLPARPGG